ALVSALVRVSDALAARRAEQLAPNLLLRSCPREARTASRSMAAASGLSHACCGTSECVAILRGAIVAARRWLLRMRAEECGPSMFDRKHVRRTRSKPHAEELSARSADSVSNYGRSLRPLPRMLWHLRMCGNPSRRHRRCATMAPQDEGRR